MRYIFVILILGTLLDPISEATQGFPQSYQSKPALHPLGEYTITAYNVGDPHQTDESPCIGASGKDLCELVKTECVIATNDFPLGKKLMIDGIGWCTVEDRMNERYTGKKYIDLALPLGTKAKTIIANVYEN